MGDTAYLNLQEAERLQIEAQQAEARLGREITGLEDAISKANLTSEQKKLLAGALKLGHDMGLVISGERLYANGNLRDSYVTTEYERLLSSIKPKEKADAPKKEPDGPLCPDCGHIMVRAGSCHRCLNCGAQIGCS